GAPAGHRGDGGAIRSPGGNLGGLRDRPYELTARNRPDLHLLLRRTGEELSVGGELDGSDIRAMTEVAVEELARAGVDDVQPAAIPTNRDVAAVWTDVGG